MLSASCSIHTTFSRSSHSWLAPGLWCLWLTLYFFKQSIWKKPDLCHSGTTEKKTGLNNFFARTKNHSKITIWNRVLLPKRVSLSSLESIDHILYPSNIYSCFNTCRYNSGKHDEGLQRIGPHHRLHSSLKSRYLKHLCTASKYQRGKKRVRQMSTIRLIFSITLFNDQLRHISTEIFLNVKASKVIAQNAAFSFQVQWWMHIMRLQYRLIETRPLLHKHTSRNVFRWCPLLSLKLLYKWLEQLVQRYELDSAIMKCANPINTLAHRSQRCVTKDRVWTLGKSSAPKLCW